MRTGGKTRFRLMNAVPDESSLDVLVDSKSVSSNLAYGTSTDTCPRIPAPIRLGLSLPDQVRRCCNSPSVSALVPTPPSSLTTFPPPLPTWCLPTTTQPRPRAISKFGSSMRRQTWGRPTSTSSPREPHLTTVSPTLSNLGFGATTPYQSLTAGNYEIELTSVGQKFAVVDTGSLTFSAGQVRTFVGLNNPVRRLYLRHAR